MKIVNDFWKVFNNIDKDISRKKWLRIVAKCSALIGIGVCICLFILWLIAFLFNHIDYVIIVVGGIGSIILIIRSALPERPKQREEVVRIQKSENTMEYDTITLESTYKRIREATLYDHTDKSCC